MASPSPSFQYEANTNDLLSPVWTLRIAPLYILISLILAMFVFRSGNVHDALLGTCAGMLIPLTFVAFQVTGITMKRDQTRSDVQDLHVT